MIFAKVRLLSRCFNKEAGSTVLACCILDRPSAAIRAPRQPTPHTPHLTLVLPLLLFHNISREVSRE